MVTIWPMTCSACRPGARWRRGWVRPRCTSSASTMVGEGQRPKSLSMLWLNWRESSVLCRLAFSLRKSYSKGAPAKCSRPTLQNRVSAPATTAMARGRRLIQRPRKARLKGRRRALGSRLDARRSRRKKIDGNTVKVRAQQKRTPNAAITSELVEAAELGQHQGRVGRRGADRGHAGAARDPGDGALHRRAWSSRRPRVVPRSATSG